MEQVPCSCYAFSMEHKPKLESVTSSTVMHFNNYRLGIYSIISVYKYIHMYALITKLLN